MRKPAQSVSSHLFTVRLWQEDLGDGQHEWRGEVKDVASGQQHAFRDWDKLVWFFKVACAALMPEDIDQKVE